MKNRTVTEDPALSQTAVSGRFLFFVFSYWCDKSEGKGNLSLIAQNGFPSEKNIKERALEMIQEKYNEPDYKINIVIENWIEMSEADFKEWVS